MKKVLAGLVFCAWASAATAGIFDGQTVQYQYLLFTPTNPFDDGAAGNYVVGPGPEISTFAYNLDIGGDGFTVQFTISDHWTTVPFNGFRLTDVNGTIPAFTSFTMGANTGLLTETYGNPVLTFDADNLYVNWRSIGFQPGITEFQVGVNAVPEPENYAMLLAGMTLLGFRLARRTRR